MFKGALSNDHSSDSGKEGFKPPVHIGEVTQKLHAAISPGDMTFKRGSHDAANHTAPLRINEY